MAASSPLSPSRTQSLRTSLLSLAALAFAASLLPACAGLDDSLIRINEVQFRATHNSYHIANALTVVTHPDLAYSHPPVRDQLDSGIRGLEFDVFFKGSQSRVYHDPRDAGTHCTTLDECLRQVSDWSNDHPGHHPLMLHVEVKEFNGNLQSAINSIEATTQSIFGILVVKSNDVLGAEVDLKTAVANNGWPTLDVSRGKVILAIEFDDDVFTADSAAFTADVLAAADVAFIFGADTLVGTEPWSVVRSVSGSALDPPGPVLAILQAENAIVRVRVDDDLKPSANATDAIDLGIQWLATDFPVRNDHSDQFLDLPGGVPSLCVSQTPGCIATDIESGISPVIGAPSDDYFCCERDVFILFVLLFCILMIFIHWILYGCVQLPRWGAMRCFCWLLYIEDDIDEQIQMLSVRLLGLLFGIQVTSSIQVFFIRAVTDVYILRNEIEPDNLMVLATVFVQEGLVAVLVLTCWMLASKSASLKSVFQKQSGQHALPKVLLLQTCIVGPVFSVLAIALEGSRVYDYTQFGDEGFTVLSVFLLISVLVALFAASSMDKTPVVIIMVAVLLMNTVQFFLICIAAAASIEPDLSLANSSERVILWQNTFMSLGIFVLAVFATFKVVPGPLGSPPRSTAVVDGSTATKDNIASASV